MNLNAMIFAAGVGSRLKPYTDTTPKALVKVGGHTLLEIALKKMAGLGIKRVVINVHHFADQIKNFLYDYASPGMEILLSDESSQLLDTGGGLLNAMDLFEHNADILLYNVDIITNAPLHSLIEEHNRNSSLATLLIQDRKASRYLLFDDNMQLCGWHNPSTGDEVRVEGRDAAGKAYGFSGIQVVRNEIIGQLRTDQACFPIIPEYLRLAANHKITGWQIDKKNIWFDIGSPEKLRKAEEFFHNNTADIVETILK